jgi:hypothetical protein
VDRDGGSNSGPGYQSLAAGNDGYVYETDEVFGKMDIDPGPNVNTYKAAEEDSLMLVFDPL